MEAPPGFEPGMEVLQTSALPLGDGAGRNWGSKLTWNVRPSLLARTTATSGERVITQGNRNGVVDWRTVVSSSPLLHLHKRAERSGREPRHPLSSARSGASDDALAAERAGGPTGPDVSILERETGFEPATSTLARSHSTTELFPHLRRAGMPLATPDRYPEALIVPHRHRPSKARPPANISNSGYSATNAAL